MIGGTHHVRKFAANGPERFACLLRVLIQGIRGDAGIETDDGDSVGHGVVKVLRNAEAFHCHTTTRLGFAGLLSTLGSLREGYQILLARP
ncbi:hypothetical protein BHE16_08905 [Neomicrococcus aestuarii]|uniref:Uncharacterized protein n=1 Tax=Neomicrococcus aestuarii TaxID=556325 RepID=A0A1L2ZP09_9MICC|nr:hypothetical protein BHE16_08905 [Neomicrococcus aestuarii]